MHHRCRQSINAASLVILIATWTPLSAESPRSGELVTDVVTLSESKVTESSGLAASWRRPGFFWTHNDSGDQARVYASNSAGKSTGRLELVDVQASDWEDIASFVDGGVPRLLIADCGDNDRRRRSITLYLVDEPDPEATTRLNKSDTEVFSIVYSDGPRDCEAVAVDPHRRQILLITKSFFPSVGVYTIPLPPRTERSLSARHSAIAQRVATLPIPMVTAMDIDQRNGDIWVAGYFQAFGFRCQDRSGGIPNQLAKLPEPIELPRWRQIEGFAVDRGGRLWLTSEGSPAPMGRIPVPVSP